MADNRRLAEWMDLAADLLTCPRPDFPLDRIALQLGQTFPTVAITWDWRTAPGCSGFRTWPELDFTPISHLPAWHVDTILNRHPVVRWYLTTQNPAPQTTARVPAALAPRRDRQLIEDYLGPLGLEQQMSIPYLLDGASYSAFIMGRTTDDYSDEDLELAAHLQRLIRALHLRAGPVARNPLRAAKVCAAAEHLGLTATELAVLTLLGEGLTAYGIARRLEVSPRTVHKHLEHLYRKLGVRDRLAAVLTAAEGGLLHPPADIPARSGILSDRRE
jgi:DNA-binding CsgD family transcriptional regulator